MKDMIALFLMTEKGYRVLEAIEAHFPGMIECVISSRDVHIVKDYYDEIKVFCQQKGIVFLDKAQCEAIKSSYAIAVSWRWLIDLSTTLIVFHDSLLPKYRGFAPLVSALINGDNRIGVTALFASEEYDRGDIIAQSECTVNYPIKIQNAIQLLSENYKALAIKIVSQIMEGHALNGMEQDDREASYSLWHDEEDYIIDWEKSSEEIKRFIDAVGYPYKGALSILENKKARIIEAEVVDDVHIENRTPGKVIFVKDHKPVVVCGKGLIRIIDLVDAATNASLLPLSKFRIRFNEKMSRF